MSILSDFEERLGGAVEGMFGALFRSPVQPAELARASSKEMTRSRKLGVDKVYVANVYFVFISVRDADTLGGLVATLEGELETYLLAYARERDFQLATRPLVRFTTDEKLRLGRFDVIGEQMTVAEIFEELGSVAGVTDDLDAGPAKVIAQDAWEGAIAQDDREGAMAPELREEWIEPAQAERPITAVVRCASISVPGYGERSLEAGQRYVLGRQQGCEICVEDANVSRRNSELYWDGQTWSIRDLGSTNGTVVNGRAVRETPLHDGDRVTLGVSELIFHETSRMGRTSNASSAL